MSTGVLDKWSCGGFPGDRAGEVAARTLKDRFGTVDEAFFRAAEASDDDAAAVHALRVAARRAAAAVRVYADWLPGRQVARWKDRLDRIRRVAGIARDADVLARRLAEFGPNPEIPAVLEQVRRQRRKAHKPIRRLHQISRDKDWFGRRVKKLLRQVRRRAEWDDTRFDTWAQTQLTRTAARFFKSAPADDDDRALHRLRIRAKDLRYSLELFAGAFPSDAAEEAYRSVDAVQRDLGDINDQATGLAVLRDRLRETEDPDAFDHLRAIVTHEKARLDRSREAFLRSWSAGRGDALRARLTPLLGNKAGPRLAVARKEAVSV